MIFFKPTVQNGDDKRILFQAIENEVSCGSCVLEINGDKAEVFSVNCDKDKLYLVEGLLKSAFNYAALKNCYMGYCKSEEFTDILDKLNLIKSDGLYFNDIPSFLSGNCCKGKDII